MQDKAEIFRNTLGEIIKSHRLKAKKSMYKISAECSVPKATWERIEKGFNDGLFLNIYKMAHGLDIEPDILVRELKEILGKDFLNEE